MVVVHCFVCRSSVSVEQCERACAFEISSLVGRSILKCLAIADVDAFRILAGGQLAAQGTSCKPSSAIRGTTIAWFQRQPQQTNASSLNDISLEEYLPVLEPGVRRLASFTSLFESSVWNAIGCH